MTEKDLLKQIKGKTIEEIENIFKIHSKEISELENSIGKSKYDIIKYEILNTISTLVDNKDIDQLNIFIKNPIGKEVGKILGNENYIQYAIYEKLRTIDNEEYKDYIIKAINEIQFIGDIRADLLTKNRLLKDGEKIEILSKNIKLLKEEIEKFQFIGLTSAEFTKLVLSTNDEELIKKCIQDDKVRHINKVNLIMNLKNEEYTRQCIEDKNLRGINKTYLLEELNDIDYIKNCIKNEEICLISRAQLLIYLNDKDYTTECIENGIAKHMNELEKKNLIYTMYKDCSLDEFDKILNNQNLQLNVTDKALLVLKLNNKDYIEQFLQANKYDLNPLEKNILKFATDKDKYFPVQNQDRKKLTIPANLRYGIEIESRRNSFNWISTKTY